MEIICPECKFSRNVPDDKIPDNSVNATCPQCGIKFRFRNIPADAPEFLLEQDPPVEAQPAAQPPEQANDTTGESESSYAASQPETPPAAHDKEEEESKVVSEQEDLAAPGPAAAQEQPTPRPQPAEKEQDGIWQKLDDMGEYAPQSGPYAQEAPDDVTVEVPFEELERYGFFNGIMETTKRAMLAPQLFFSAMPIGKTPRSALIYYILVSEFGLLFQSVWEYIGLDVFALFGGQTSSQAQAAADMSLQMFIAQQGMLLLVVGPIMLFGGMYLFSGIIHLLLKLTGAAQEGFATTLRVNSYSNAPNMLYIVPIAGPVVAFFWQFAINIIGLKHAHKAPWGRVALAYALLAILFMIFGMYVAASGGPGVQTF